MDQGSIGKLGNKVDDTKVGQTQGDKQSPASSTAGKGSSGETVQLTTGAQLLSRMEKSLAAAPAVDSAKVAEVKAAIESGNYEIDTGAIADAMIRFERSLGD